MLRTPVRALLALSACALLPPSLAAQEAPPADALQTYVDEIQGLIADPVVRAALEHIDATDEQTMADLVELTEIPAPPFMEEERGRRFAEMLTALGVDSVWVDEEGNVLALRRGAGSGGTLAVTAHLDTVFPEGTDVTVRMRGDTLAAPGIADDTRGLAALLAILRALNEASVRTQGDLLFVGTVGEEGLGDLRGVKYLFREGGPRIDSFISIDGTSDAGVTHQGLGSHRYRVTFLGPGGHSWGAFGLANPAHALGRAIRYFQDSADVYTREAPRRTSYNVGRIGGGTSVNSVPFESWMEIDMRSEGVETLETVDGLLHAAVARALEEENALKRRGESLTVDVDQIGDRPSGEVPITDPLVLRAAAATEAVEQSPRFGRSSTDSNVPIALGIPAVTIGGGGVGIGAHSPDEVFVNENGARGIRRALLLVVAQAGLARAS